LARAADIDLLLIDHALPDDQLPYLISQLRADRDSGLLPVLVMAPPDQMERLSRRFERYRNVWVVSDLIWRDPEDLKKTLPARVAAAMGKPLTKDERNNYAAESMHWLNRLALGEISGYDVRLAQRTILDAMRSDDLAMASLAIEAAGQMPGATA